MSSKKEFWSSSKGFILAMAGSAIGLGNIWRFSYIMGKYGGAAFFLSYIGAIFLIGLPVMLCELTLGRAAQSGPLDAMMKLAPAKTKLSKLLAVLLFLGAGCFVFAGMRTHAVLTALLGVGALIYGWGTLGFAATYLTPLMISVFYSVVGGWIIIYTFLSLKGGIFRQSVESSTELLNGLVLAQNGKAWIVITAALLFFLMTCGIVLAGIKKGIERFSNIFMPVIFILFLVIIVRALTLPGAKEGLRFLFLPDFSKLTAEAVMAALGQAFFTLSLGAGVGIAYGAYLDRSVSLVKTAVTIVLMDTFASILAGLAIFPILFATGLDPQEGTSLVFKVLPLAFGKLPLSALWGFLFFFTLLLAALTSSISMLEGAVMGLMDKLSLSRAKAVAILAVVLGSLVPITALSAANYDNLPVLGSFLQGTLGLKSESFFAVLDNTTCLWLMPLTGLATIFFVVLVWGRKNVLDEMRVGGEKDLAFAKVWFFVVSFITPLLVIAAFLKGLNIIF